ncbi:DUF6734 family protein [Deminuibacter soli]|uniref:DUF6734 domain-containing protein n=1 Tax=Deminuibacter soli TaxID=2291815 RepID=A0A3E1NFK7_9BACT|nr:DUF6734 family protein [Deminuibacter soli]RFM26749.1 hypothetical protein DXN05_17280 [Deminuibacter soli]
MRIVQTFWSSGKDWKTYNFGWDSPKFHLMGWALSCLKLKEFYPDVHLYTDTAGAELLINRLNLPYTAVHISHDDLNHAFSTHWAISKIKTYALQEKPFLHVDADVFIFDKFADKLEKAGLVMQNFEMGTAVYRKLTDTVYSNLCSVPAYLDTDLCKNAIPSCNAGIFGGHDLDFIREYTNVATNFFEDNVAAFPNDIADGFNIICEQILFHSLCSNRNKQITYLFDKQYQDDGYVMHEFADFALTPTKLKYLHLIGKHKRTKDIVELMARTLLKEYPAYFYKILEAFDDEHKYYQARMAKDNTAAQPQSGALPIYQRRHSITHIKDKEHWGAFPRNSKNETTKEQHFIKELQKYETQLSELTKSWKQVPGKDLLEMETSSLAQFEFFLLPLSEQNTFFISRHPWLDTIESPFNWYMPIESMDGQLKEEDKEVIIACTPEIFYHECREVVIDELEYNILALLDKAITFADLLRQVHELFPSDNPNNGPDEVLILTLIKIRRLLANKFISIFKPVEN